MPFGFNFKHALLTDTHTPHHWLEIVIEGNDAEKPAAGTAGRLYWATDTFILYRDNGVSWVELWRAEDVIRLAQLAEKSHNSLTNITASQHHTKTSKLSEITIDVDKDWNKKNITNFGTKGFNLQNQLIKGIIFNLGLATVGTKQAQALIPGTLTISKVKIYADTAPIGASLIVDVNKNGATIFTTQANRPAIPSGGHADDSGAPNVTSLAEGNRLSVDTDQIGSTIAGGDDLLVTIIFE